MADKNKDTEFSIPLSQDLSAAEKRIASMRQQVQSLSKAEEEASQNLQNLVRTQKQLSEKSDVYKEMTVQLKQQEEQIKKLTDKTESLRKGIEAAKKIYGDKASVSGTLQELQQEQEQLRLIQQEAKKTKEALSQMSVPQTSVNLTANIAAENQKLQQLAKERGELLRVLSREEAAYNKRAIEIARQKAAQGTLTAEDMRRTPAGTAIPIKVKSIFTKDKHDYERVANPSFTPDKSGITKLSVTKVVGKMTHEVENYEERIKEINAQMSALQKAGKGTEDEYLQLVDELYETERASRNFKNSSNRGTAVHKVEELLADGEITLEELTAQRVRELSTRYEEIARGLKSQHVHADGRTPYERSEAGNIVRVAKKIQELKAKYGITGKETAEQSLGAVINTGKNIVELVGTLDGFLEEYEAILFDYKTSATVDTRKIGGQLTYGNFLRKVNDLPTAKKMQVIHAPFSTRKDRNKNTIYDGDIYEVDALSASEFMRALDESVEMEEGRRSAPSQLLPSTMRSKLTSYEWGNKDGAHGMGWKLNGIPLTDLAKEYKKGYITFDEILSQVKNLDPKDLQHFIQLIWSTKEYGTGLPKEGRETNKLYRSDSPLWNLLRHNLSSPYNALHTQIKEGQLAMGFGERDFVDERGEVPVDAFGYTFGGAFPREWAKMYRLATPEGQEKIANLLGTELAQAYKEGAEDKVFRFLEKVEETGKEEINVAFAEAIRKQFAPNDLGVAPHGISWSDITEDNIQSQSPGWGSRKGQHDADEERKRNDKSNFQKEVWEVAKDEDGLRAREGLIPRDERFNAATEEEAMEQAANRLARVMDIYQRVMNIFTQIARKQNYTGDIEELAASYLARNNPDMYARFLRGKEITNAVLSEVPSGSQWRGAGSRLPVSLTVQAFRAIKKQLNPFSNEEGSLLTALNELESHYGGTNGHWDPELNEDGSIDLGSASSTFWKTFGNRIRWQFNGKAKDSFVAEEVLTNLINGRGFGKQEEVEDLFDPAKLQAQVGNKTDESIEQSVDESLQGMKEFPPLLDYIESKLKDEASSLDITNEQIINFRNWLEKLNNIADTAGSDLGELLGVFNYLAQDSSIAFAEDNVTAERIWDNIPNELEQDLLLTRNEQKGGLADETREILFDRLDSLLEEYEEDLSKNLEEYDKLREEQIAQQKLERDNALQERDKNIGQALIELGTKKSSGLGKRVESEDGEIEGPTDGEIEALEQEIVENLQLINSGLEFSAQTIKKSNQIAEEISSLQDEEKQNRQGAVEANRVRVSSTPLLAASPTPLSSTNLVSSMGGALNTNGSMLDVHPTSNTPADTTGLRKGFEFVNDLGRKVYEVYQVVKERTYTDWGNYKSQQGFIKAKQGLPSDKMEEVKDELTQILLPKHSLVDGGLDASGRKSLQNIMEKIFGDAAKADMRISAPKVIVEGNPVSIYTGPATVDLSEIQMPSGTIVVEGNVTLEGNIKRGGSGARALSHTGHSDKQSGDGENSENNQEEPNGRFAEYKQLWQEQYQTEYKIVQLEQQRVDAHEKSNKADEEAFVKRIADLQKLHEEQELQMNEIAYNHRVPNSELTDEDKKNILFNEREQKELENMRQRKEVAMAADKAGFESEYQLRSQIQTEQEMQDLLRKRLGLESKIHNEKATIRTSWSRDEKNSLREVISLQEKEIGLLDQKILKLINSGKYRKEELQEILQEYQAEHKLAEAQGAAKQHGAKGLFGRIKFGVQRSMNNVLEYGMSMRLINSIPRGLQKIYQLTTQLESALTSLRIVTGMNRKEAEATMITYQKMGKELGATTQEVAQSATTWLRQGYSVQEAGKLIDASMKLSKLGFMQSEQATQTLTAALKGFKLEVSNAMSIVDKFTQMDQKAAVSAQGVSEALSLMANSARLAGLSMDQAIAMVSTVGEVTQQSMSTIGNSMKTMLARFGNVKAGAFATLGEEGEDSSENINDIEKVLRKLGINIRSSTGEMREFDDVLADIAGKWTSLDSVSKNAIAGALGGVRQREAVVTLLENYERYQELTEESEKSAGSANKKYEAYADSLEAALKRLTNAWEEFTQKLKASPLVKNGVKFITFLIEKMDKLVTIVSAFGGRLLGFRLSKGLTSLLNFDGSKYMGFFGKLGGFFGKIGGAVQKKWQSNPFVATKHNIQVAGRFYDSIQSEATILRSNNQAAFTDYEAKLRANPTIVEKVDSAGRKYYLDTVSRKRVSKNAFNQQESTVQQALRAKRTELGLNDEDGNLLSEEYLRRYGKGTYDTLTKKHEAELYNPRNVADERRSFFQDVRSKLETMIDILQRFDKKTGEDKQSGNLTPEEAVGEVVEGAEEQAEIQERVTTLKQKEAMSAELGMTYEQQEVFYSQIGLTNEQKEALHSQTGLAAEQREAYFSQLGLTAEQQEAMYAQMSAAAAQRAAASSMGGASGGGGSGIAGAAGAANPWIALAQEIVQDVMSGVMAGIMAAQQLQSIEGAGANEGVSIEATNGDKAIQGAATGVLTTTISAIPLIGDTLGPVLGPILGDAIGGAILRAIHKEELDRKHRVKEAQERLEAIGELKEAITDFKGLVIKEIWESGDYEKAAEYAEQFAETLWNNRDLMTIFFEQLKKINAELGDMSFDELTDKMIHGTNEEKRDIEKAVDLATAIQNRAELQASQEDKWYNIQHSSKYKGSRMEVNGYYYNGVSQALSNAGIKMYGTFGDDLATAFSELWGAEYKHFDYGGTGETNEKRFQSLQSLIRELEELGYTSSDELYSEIAKARDYYKELVAEEETMNKELAKADVQIGYIASGLTNLSQAQQKTIGYEGAVQKVADAMEAQGIAVRTAAGAIKSEYLPLIESAIKSDENLSTLVRGETKTYGLLTDAVKRLNQVIKESGMDYDWATLKELVDFGTPENLAKLDAFANAVGMSRDAIRGLVNAANPAELQSMADALYTTVERLAELGPGLENVSQSFLLSLSPAGVREFKEGYQELYNDIVTTGSISAENMEKIVQQFPDLIEELNAGGSALEEKLREMLFGGGSDNAMNFMYGRSMLGSYLSSSDFFTKALSKEIGSSGKTLQSVMGNFFSQVDESSKVELQNLKKKWENATTFEQAMEVFENGIVQGLVEIEGISQDQAKLTAEQIQVALDQAFDFTVTIQTDEAQLEEWNRLIKYQTSLLDDQIDNLQAQKDALVSINDERKKELDLIKAKEALENAKKEKKLVYRSGVGFVYEADEEAISEAQDNLDDLETQKQQEALDMEIQRLELEKEILEYLPTVEDQAHLKQLWKEWTEDMQAVNGSLSNWTSIMADTYTKYQKIDFAKIYKEFADAADNGKSKKITAAQEEAKKLAAIQAQLDAVPADERNTLSYQKLVDEYNAQFDVFNKAVKEAQSAGASNTELNTLANGTVSDLTGVAEAGKKASVVLKEIFGTKDKKDSDGNKIGGVGKIKDASFTFSGDDVLPQDLQDQFSDMDDAYLMFLNKEGTGWTGEWVKQTTWNNEHQTDGMSIQTTDDYKKLPAYTVIMNADDDDYLMYVDSSGQLKWLNHEKYKGGSTSSRAGHALGILSTPSDENAIINELGTEAIVTPQGTLTALPSHTGIVPADITQNLWKLGEVAPNLIARLGSLQNSGFKANTGNITNNDGTFIDQLNMTVYPTKDYDMERFIADAKIKAQLTKHNN